MTQDSDVEKPDLPASERVIPRDEGCKVVIMFLFDSVPVLVS
jgi:hypothetical protein